MYQETETQSTHLPNQREMTQPWHKYPELLAFEIFERKSRKKLNWSRQSKELGMNISFGELGIRSSRGDRLLVLGLMGGKLHFDINRGSFKLPSSCQFTPSFQKGQITFQLNSEAVEPSSQSNSLICLFNTGATTQNYLNGNFKTDFFCKVVAQDSSFDIYGIFKVSRVDLYVKDNQIKNYEKTTKKQKETFLRMIFDNYFGSQLYDSRSGGAELSKIEKTYH